MRDCLTAPEAAGMGSNAAKSIIRCPAQVERRNRREDNTLSQNSGSFIR